MSLCKAAVFLSASTANFIAFAFVALQTSSVDHFQSHTGIARGDWLAHPQRPIGASASFAGAWLGGLNWPAFLCFGLSTFMQQRVCELRDRGCRIARARVQLPQDR
jgi:hypothetical protein